MPDCGSQCYLCDMPIRFDTYKGCSHGCKYCFVQKKATLDVGLGEGVDALKAFIEGKRTKQTNWCDWKIPLHWGGMSDPFQPAEKKYRRSYECLKIFAETKYPFVASTKGALVADDEYISLISQCDCVMQISAVCEKYDIMEQGAPKFNERLKMIEKLSKNCRRVIVRVQPYLSECRKDVVASMQKFKDAGAYGVILEGMKFYGKKVKGLVKIGGDYCYPYETLLADFKQIKAEAHRVGLKFYSGENRLRRLGDSLSCCGVGDIYRVNTYNLNHLLNGEKVEPTENMRRNGTVDCFKSLHQDPLHNKEWGDNNNFADYMLKYYSERKPQINEIMGLNL